jgi:hypothetical protein
MKSGPPKKNSFNVISTISGSFSKFIKNFIHELVAYQLII